MPKFFFDLRHRCGDLDPDDVGVDLANCEAAYIEAHRAAIDMWAEARRAGRQPVYRSFEIRDARDRIIWELPFREAVGFPAL